MSAPRCSAPSAPRSTRRPSLGGMNEAVELANRLAAEHGGFIPQQFSNPANPEIHRRTTAEEIWRDLDGAGRRLRRRRRHGRHDHRRRPGAEGAPPRRDRSIGVEPAASPVLSGGTPGPHKIQGIGAGFVPEVLDREVIDEIVGVSDEDALETARARGPARGAAGRDLRRRGGPRRPGSRRARGDGRQADRRDRAGLAASATCRCRSSPPPERELLALSFDRVLGLGTLRRVLQEVSVRRRLGARPRPRRPRHRHARDPHRLGRGAGAARPPRRARALGGGGAAGAADDRLHEPGRDRRRDPSGGARSAPTSSSTTARAS